MTSFLELLSPTSMHANFLVGMFDITYYFSSELSSSNFYITYGSIFDINRLQCQKDDHTQQKNRTKLGLNDS